MLQRAHVDLHHSEHPHSQEVTPSVTATEERSERWTGLYVAMGCLTAVLYQLSSKAGGGGSTMPAGAQFQLWLCRPCQRKPSV